VRANIVDTPKLRIYNPDKLGVFIVALLCAVCTLRWTISPTNQSYERWQSAALCVPTRLGKISYFEEDIQVAKQEPSKTW
jgi:hypothetical protein